MKIEISASEHGITQESIQIQKIKTKFTFLILVSGLQDEKKFESMEPT